MPTPSDTQWMDEAADKQINPDLLSVDDDDEYDPEKDQHPAVVQSRKDVKAMNEEAERMHNEREAAWNRLPEKEKTRIRKQQIEFYNREVLKKR